MSFSSTCPNHATFHFRWTLLAATPNNMIIGFIITPRSQSNGVSMSASSRCSRYNPLRTLYHKASLTKWFNKRYLAAKLNILIIAFIIPSPTGIIQCWLSFCQTIIFNRSNLFTPAPSFLNFLAELFRKAPTKHLQSFSAKHQQNTNKASSQISYKAFSQSTSKITSFPKYIPLDSYPLNKIYYNRFL